MTVTADGFYPSVTPEFTREAEAWAPGKKCPKIFPRASASSSPATWFFRRYQTRALGTKKVRQRPRRPGQVVAPGPCLPHPLWYPHGAPDPR